jgi:hypothetical protein
VSVGDIFTVALVSNLNGQVVMTTFGLRAEVDAADQMADCATRVNTALGTNWNLGKSQDINFTTIMVRDIVPGTRPLYKLAIGSQLGTIASPAAPGNCAVVVSWRTNIKGRANRGRWFIGGMVASDCVQGFWSGGSQDAASANASLIFDPFGPLGGGNYTLGIVSYVPNTKPRQFRAFVPITAFSVDNVIRSMRTREVGKGI